MRVYEATESGIRSAERELPVPSPGEVLIAVTAIALNRGEARRAVHGGFAPGLVPGWDTVGTVAALGEGVKGLALGSKVVARGLVGGWAEFRLAHADDVAPLPEGLSDAAAATLATAGTTALAVLSCAGQLLGQRVLITGASGSVGRFAIQLARLGGAHVTALARSGHEALSALGAQEVVSTLDGLQPVDLVLESLGGPTLVAASQTLASGGILQSIGWSSGQDAVFSNFDGLTRSGASVQGFAIGNRRVGKLLSTLVPLMSEGQLDPAIQRTGAWEDLPALAVEALQPGFHGKAVILLA